MSAYTVLFLDCDHRPSIRGAGTCGTSIDSGATTRSAGGHGPSNPDLITTYRGLREHAATQGWTTTGKLDFCPDHPPENP